MLKYKYAIYCIFSISNPTTSALDSILNLTKELFNLLGSCLLSIINKSLFWYCTHHF